MGIFFRAAWVFLGILAVVALFGLAVAHDFAWVGPRVIIGLCVGGLLMVGVIFRNDVT